MLILSCWRLDSIVPLSGHIWPWMHLVVRNIGSRVYNIFSSLQIIVVDNFSRCNVYVRSAQLRFVLLLSQIYFLLDGVLPLKVVVLMDVVYKQRHVEEVRVHIHRRSKC
jgi:hypothetical protein